MNNSYKNILVDGRYGFLVMLLVCAISLYGWVMAKDLIDEKMDREFEIVSEQLFAETISEFEKVLNITSSGQGLFGASIDLSRDEWENFFLSQDLFEKNPGILSVIFAEKVSSDEKESFIQRTRDEGFIDFDIEPPVDKEEYFVVNYIATSRGNKGVIGFDLSSAEDRLVAIKRSRDTKDFSLTSPIKLIMDQEDKPSFLGFLPIYKKGQPSDTLEERRENIQGFSVVVFRSDDLFLDIIKDIDHGNKIHFLLADGDITFFDSDIVEGLSSYSNDFEYSNIVEVGGRNWKFEAHATESFIESFKTERIIPPIILVVGVLFGILLFFIFLTAFRSKRKATGVATEMTEKFETEKRKTEEVNKDLERVNAELEKTLSKAEKRTVSLEEMNKMMTGRELKMMELKKEVKRLKGNSSNENN